MSGSVSGQVPLLQRTSLLAFSLLAPGAGLVSETVGAGAMTNGAAAVPSVVAATPATGALGVESLLFASSLTDA